MTHSSRLVRAALGLALVAFVCVLSACEQAWVTPTVVIGRRAEPRRLPTPTSALLIAAAQSDNQARPEATPTLALAPVEVSDAPLQYWSDPNDISALLYDGTYLWAATGGGIVRWTLDGQHRLYTLADGLPSQAVRGLALDGDGHVWIGFTDHPGWSEFAGSAWRSYATRQEAVEARYAALLAAPAFDPRLWVRRAESDWLWLTTPEGALQAYDGEIWRTYDDRHGVTRYTWLVGVTGEGRVWALGQGVSTAEEGERWWEDHTLFAEIADRSEVTDITVDAKGGLWIAFTGTPPQGGGVCRLVTEGDSVRWEGYLPELSPAIPGQVYDLEIDAEGTIWLCGEGALSYHRLGTPWRRLPLEGLDVHGFALEGTPRSSLVRYRVTPGGAEWLWVATSRGLWAMNIESGESLGPWLVPSPIIGSAVVGLAHDAQGRLWVATRDGVSFIEPGGATQAMLVEPIYCLESDRAGRIWAGAAAGLYRLAAEEAPQRVIDTPISVLGFDRENRPYACTTEGRLLALADASGAAQPEPLADLIALAGAMPRDLDVDSKGTVWFATERGLGSLTADGVFDLSTEGERLLSSDVRAVDVGADDLVWVATAKGPARRRPDGRWTRFTTQSTEGGLRAMEMWHLYAPDDGMLWMATSAGISRREPENADWAYFDLPEPRIVLPDAQGGIWIGTRSGLYRVRGDALVPVE
ncbi:MAG: hypothetical protein JXA74_16815 [Anaerolineae bacterium]|nr:hypothetical protein [Anaerolineae bacterium]